MSITIGRLGYIGLGIEATPGSVQTPAVFLPYTANTMRGHHTPIEVIASKTSRIMDTNSVVGKKWSQGDVELDLDVVNAGYLYKMALGNEILTNGTPNQHLFFTSISGNTPKTATLIYGRGDTDVEQYTYAALETLVLNIPVDKLATAKATFMGKFPTTPAAQTPVTTSGTFVTFTSTTVGFGADLTTAAAASATPVSDYTMTIANNLDMIHQTGSADVRAIRNKGVRISGAYTLYFETTTDRDAHYNLLKRAMVIKTTGNANESIVHRVSQFRLKENDISTGLDTFYIVKGDWVAEDDLDTGTGTRYIDVAFNNSYASVY